MEELSFYLNNIVYILPSRQVHSLGSGSSTPLLS